MSFKIYGEFKSKPGEQVLLGESDELTSSEAILGAYEALGDLVQNLEAVRDDTNGGTVVEKDV